MLTMLKGQLREPFWNFVGIDLTKVKKNSCYNSQLVTTKQDYFYIAFSYYPNKDL